MDASEIAEFVGDCIEKNLHCIVVCGVFAPVNAEQEQRAVAMVQAELAARVGTKLAQGYAVTASSEVAGMGLLERESAAILNACVQPLAQRTVRGFEQSLRDLELSCPLYLTQNDGTVASVATTERLPIGTFSSGPTNSMRGAAFVSGRMDAVVVDVGGTTTDVGLLVGGFPRQAGLLAEIGGVQTNYAIPDTVSIGLGAHSIGRLSFICWLHNYVLLNAKAALLHRPVRVVECRATVGGGSVLRRPNGDAIKLGPDSVGHRLTSDALCFGGHTVTATDVAVVMG